MSPHRCLPLVALFLTAGFARSESHGLKLPPGFEVSEYAGSELANDIFTMTLDAQGRPVVSGRGYIRILADDNGDGKADRAIPFAAGPADGAMGLFWEGDWLYFSGDGGLRRYPIDKSGDKAAGPAELIRAMRTGGEHHAHAIRRGPDGWLYVLAGNTTGIDKSFASLPTSPIQEPVAGCLLRFTPDLKQSEIVADGFRNAYDFDWNADGEIFTYDSDNERCVALPWYEPTRLYHVIPGGRHGWLSPQRGTFWRMPPYFADVVAPVATLDRGSPTACVCYRHVQFPEKYRGGFFLADWTFGRIWFVKLKRAGSTYQAEKEVFLQATGENGFAPTALAVDPKSGDLFVSIGGRGTRGAVYRIRHAKGGAADAQQVAALQPPKATLDWTDLASVQKQVGDADRLTRLRGLIQAYRYRSRPDLHELAGLTRQAWNDPDRYVTMASARLVAALGPTYTGTAQRELADGPRSRAAVGLAAPTAARGQLLAVDHTLGPQDRLAGVRILQLALGDVGADSAKGTYGEGYTRRGARVEGVNADALRKMFPTGESDLDREIARTLAMVEDDHPDSVTKMVGRWTADSALSDDIHYLAVLSRLKGPRSLTVTQRTADTLLALDKKATAGKIYRDSNWPLRLAEIHAELSRHDPALNAAVLAHAEFGRPDHATLARSAGFPRRQAAQRFLTRSKEPGFTWNAELVGLVGELPAEQALPVLRGLWGQAGLEDAILPVLARQAEAADRDKFLFGLRSPQTATLRTCLDALDKFPAQADDELLITLVRVIRRLSDSKEEKQLREQVGKLLTRLTGQAGPSHDPKAWTDWLQQARPELAAKLGGADGVDVNAWKQRLAGIDWTKGDAARGQAVFTRASCAACHSGTQALGPDLRGITGRFSRDDLLTAILQPSRDVSGRYRTTAVETADGKVYQGLIIYEATDSLILQTGPAVTIRLVDTQIVGRGYSDVSLMPTGTLDKVKDEEIADLLAYLRSLQ